MKDLDAIAAELGERLKARGETVSVAESSSGGLISAALLGVPGASAYFLGGGVIYTKKARAVLMDLPREAVAGMTSASEPYALLLAQAARERLGATWGISETGIAGPTGGPNMPPGLTAVGIAGPVEMAVLIRTGSDDRLANMNAFAAAALELLNRALSD